VNQEIAFVSESINPSTLTRHIAIMLTATLLEVLSARAQSVSDYAVLVSATVQTNPAQITLSWPADPQATSYIRYRKTRDATTWGTGTTLATNATSFVDSSVTIGTGYEYRVSKTGLAGGAAYSGEGYIYTGIAVPLTEARGKMVLLVDNTVASSLAMELTRLQLDLVGDGWTVLRHDVARTDTVANIKSLIKADYNADTVNVKAVFIFGHVPVPYSGDLNPDGHSEHLGAWPADLDYAEMTSTWTDTTVNDTGASDPRNRNTPGDTKLDQSIPASTVELQVGRVDLANLPSFSQSEIELLRQYLDKDHNFRNKFVTAQRRALVDDNFGTFGGEAFALSGWRNFAPLFGATNIFATGDWFGTLRTQSYLFGYGCGSGIPTGAGGVGTTADLAANDPRVVFTMFFGSWFGDWDSQDNFLRAPLATPTYTLASAWAGRPHWMFHHMGLGETIGFSTRVTQNNATTYAGNIAQRWVHIALMGDPSLRLHAVSPVTALTVTTNGGGGVTLRWKPSQDSVAGYHVYRATTSAGPFSRLTSSLLTTTNYTDPLVSSNIYMVRAVTLEQSPSGTYYNPSQGVFQSLNSTFAAPAISLVQPTNNATVLAPGTLQLRANTFDPANSITNVAFYTNGVKLTEFTTPPYTLSWSNIPLGIYSLQARASWAGGVLTATNAVTVTVDNGASPRLTLTSFGQQSNVISGQDLLARVYHLQVLTNLTTTNWQTIGSATSSSSGTFQFIDPASAPQRFYRTVYP
jgi:hypothetical protein